MKPYIIPIFIPHFGCSHQCIFCNQKKITGRETPVTAGQVSDIINERLANGIHNRYIEVAFYGGSFTALSKETQNELLEPASQALSNGLIHAIRLSTRPDNINDEIVNNLKMYGVSIVELGVQSLDDRVLRQAERGHNREAVKQAVRVLKSHGISCGLQLMPGLPGEDWISLIRTVKNAAALSPEFIRIYPVVVIAGTALATMYRSKEYQPLTLNEAVNRSAYMKVLFEHNGIKVIRTGLQASEELNNSETVLAGPYHPAFGELVDAKVFYFMIASFLDKLPGIASSKVALRHNPKDSSKIRGQHNQNIRLFRKRFALSNLELVADSSVACGSILLQNAGMTYHLSKNTINLF